MTPTDGFQDPSLSTILSFAVTSPTGTGTGTSGSGNSTGSSAPGSSSTSTNSPTPVAAIAGGAAGGVVVIALIAIGVFLYRRKNRKQEEDNLASPKPPLPYGEYRDDERKAPAPTELPVQPPELGGDHMVELPGHEVAREMPPRP